MSERIREIHARPAQTELGVGLDYLLSQGGQCDRNLDPGARLASGTQGELLVQHGQYAAVTRINHHDRTVAKSQRIHVHTTEFLSFAVDCMSCSENRKAR